MRLTLVIALLFSSLTVQASWFGSDPPEYTNWDTKQLKSWLKEHDIQTPKGYSQQELHDLVKENWWSYQAWTQEQYDNAQKTFHNVKDNSFEAWDESRLREWLLEQGVVAPSGPREKLVLLAKQRYNAYTNAASSLGSSASSVFYDTSNTASSLYSTATNEVGKKFDDTKDYVYSSWDDSQLHQWLIDHGVLQTSAQKTRAEMLKLMQEYYAKVADPVYSAWSDSYLYNWLRSHNIIKSDYEKKRDALLEQMSKYYYDTSDVVWSTWSDSELRSWLLDHNIIKSSSQVQREKMLKLVTDNYNSAYDTFWSAWSDSEMRAWLIEHGYMKSDYQAKRDELIKLINEKYNSYSPRTVPYVTWPDARLRAYLRSHGVTEAALPATRSGLLQEVRVHYVQGTNHINTLFNKIRDTLTSGVEAAEERIGRVLEMLSSGYDDAGNKAKEGREWTEEKTHQAKKEGHKLENEL